jgi:hypothetical protein
MDISSDDGVVISLFVEVSEEALKLIFVLGKEYSKPSIESIERPI